MGSRKHPARVVDASAIGAGDMDLAVTLRDVAARAMVSPIVVSRVLHNKALTIKVADATAERVRDAARELGYKKNVAAVNFRTRQTMSIGILHGMGEHMPRFEGGTHYFAALMDGFVAGAFAEGYSVTLCPKLFGKTPSDAMSDGRFDGLVLYDLDLSQASHSLVRDCAVPLVIVHSHAREFDVEVPSVVCDNFQGIGLAVDHLISLGHREIAFAHQPWYHSAELRDRKEAFLFHLKSAGVSGGNENLVIVDSNANDYGNLFAGRFTAVITHHEHLASCILRAAPTFGVRVPEDLSVVGFDSTSFCNELRPALTSVSQPLQEMGARAIELLVAQIRGESEGPTDLTYPCGLDVRDSTQSIDAQVNS